MKRSCRQKVRGCALNSVEHPHGENHQQCETVDQILASSSTRLEGQKKRSAKTSSLIPESITTADVEMAPRVHDIFNITGVVTGGEHRHQFRNDLKSYRDDMQRTSAACSFSTVEGIQQVSRSRQCSRRRCGRTLRIDQIVDTNRSRRGVGAQLYIPRLLEIVERRPVYVRLALWFLHHPAWMESHTGGSRLTPTVHPCPV